MTFTVEVFSVPGICVEAGSNLTYERFVRYPLGMNQTDVVSIERREKNLEGLVHSFETEIFRKKYY